MNVRHDPVGCVDGVVNRHRRAKDAVDAADQEHAQESDGEEHWRLEGDLAAPHRGDPVEELHPCWHSNEEGHHREEGQEDAAGRKHVVGPDAKAECADRSGGEDEGLVAEERLAAEDWKDLGDHTHGWQHHDIHGRVAIEPEDVLPQDGRAAECWVKECATEVSVDEEHHEGTR